MSWGQHENVINSLKLRTNSKIRTTRKLFLTRRFIVVYVPYRIQLKIHTNSINVCNHSDPKLKRFHWTVASCRSIHTVKSSNRVSFVEYCCRFVVFQIVKSRWIALVLPLIRPRGLLVSGGFPGFSIENSGNYLYNKFLLW